ncbi:ABC transporter ATP-binding protein [Kroppenstedtia eburnea]|uniref:ABC-2 type transport system ATP-binding protein n=1 Tax=Kroppenstedtia eburnea TaxID=714067 RepID=A0A1N7KF18_9BACL|nr:ABC transporter ATP-binding protein [Kroppenstedtia eburnea]QKI83015.1 ABC transporter ATP-binding protein [Kroppenstedtia eburnea]SIS60198.1 ABC-2 type transport system ATP-binding protein [Kroppenstedtia eburnea]
MENQQPILEIRHLTKVIGKKKIVDDLSLQVYPGEVFGFLGPNGAGKTTTIRMIVGLIGITGGEVLINGINLKENFEKTLSHVGGIVENPEMYKFLTGYQNLIHYWRMTRGIPKTRIDEVVRQVGLENRIHDKVKTYSLGMRQRLGLAQALLHSPSLLILDEPTNGLDPAGIREFREHLRRLAREENIAVLVSSHILSEMEQMCDRIAVIQHGKLIDVKQVREFVGTAREQQTVLFTVNPIPQAKKCLQSALDGQPLEVTPEGIKVTTTWDEIPILNARLVEAGIQVFSIRPATRTLEDEFLEMTGGTQIV